jgi:hypothetical protein
LGIELDEKVKIDDLNISLYYIKKHVVMMDFQKLQKINPENNI